MNKKYLATGVIAAIFVIGCGSSPASDDDVKRLDNQANGTAGTIQPASKQIIEGTWKIGTKDNIAGGVISPGTYVISGLEDGYNCYWARVKNFDGELDSVIANDNISPGSTARVNVKKTDKGLELKGECLAKKAK